VICDDGAEGRERFIGEAAVAQARANARLVVGY